MPFTHKLQVLWAIAACYWAGLPWETLRFLGMSYKQPNDATQPIWGQSKPSWHRPLVSLFLLYICQGTDLHLLCVYEGTVELRSQTVSSHLNSVAGKNKINTLIKTLSKLSFDKYSKNPRVRTYGTFFQVWLIFGGSYWQFRPK